MAVELVGFSIAAFVQTSLFQQVVLTGNFSVSVCNCASSDCERELDRIAIIMFSIHKEEHYKSCAARGSFNVKMMASQKRDPTWKNGE